MFSASARSRYNCAIASTSCSSEVTRTAYSYTSWPRCNSAMPVSTRCPVVGSCSSTASASRTFRRRITTRRGRLQPLNCNWLLKPSQPAPAVLPDPEFLNVPLHLRGLLQLEQVRQATSFGFLHHPLGAPTDITSQQMRPLLPRARI